MQKFAAFVVLSLVVTGFSATHKVPQDEPIATISIPDKWLTKALGEGVEATSPDGALRLIAIPPEGKKVAEGIGELMRYIRNTDGIVVKPESIKNEPGTLNGVDIRNVSWQGKDRKGGDVNIRFTIVSFANSKQLLVACWGPPKTEKKYEPVVKKMLLSIKQT
jgi:hypothetical protein